MKPAARTPSKFIPEYNETANNRGRRICRRVFYLSWLLLPDNEKNEREREERKADLGGSVSRHVFRVYNELSGKGKIWEGEGEKILENRGVCEAGKRMDGFCEET